MADDRLKFLVQNFGGSYGGSGISSTLKREVKPDRALAPQVAQPGIFDKISRVLGQTASIGANVTGAAARFVGNTAVDIAQAGYGVGKTLVDLSVQPFQLSAANRNLEQINQKEKALHDAYRAGKVSKEDYTEGLRQTKQARSDINEHVLKPISDGPGVKERAEDVIETAVNVLSLGGWSLAKSAGKTAAKDVAKNGIQKSLDGAVDVIQNNLLRIPAAKELIARNAAAAAKREAQRAAGETMEQYMVREGKRVAIGLLVKRPLFYQQNIQDATNIYNGMVTGDYGSALKSAGWLASQMLGGGPVGWFMSQGKNMGIKLRDLSRGRGSFIDKLSSQIGNGNAAQIARYLHTLQEKAPNEFKKSEEILRIMQETNLRVADERVDDAVKNILQHFNQSNVSAENINPKMLVDYYSDWYEAAKIVDSLKGTKIPGLDEHQIANLVVIRWDSIMKRGLAEAIAKAGDNRQAMADVLNDLAGRAGVGWGNNPLLMKQLTRIIDESATAKEAARRIKAIPTATAMPDGLPKSAQKKLADLGYGVAVPLGGSRKTPMVKLEDTRKLVSAAINPPKPRKLRNPALNGVDDETVKKAQRAASFDEFMDSMSIFRGQAKEFADLQKVEQTDAINNILIGRGVFTTTDKDMAKTYGENVFRLTRPRDAKRILDLGSASDETLERLGVRNSTRQLYKDLLEEGSTTGYEGHTYTIDGETWRVLNVVRDSETNEQMYRLAKQGGGGGQRRISVEEFEKKYDPQTSFKSQVEAENILFEVIAEKYLPEDVTWNMVKYGSENDLPDGIDIESVRDIILAGLKKQGFDWIKHQGGIRAGGGEKLHDVYIALDNRVLNSVDEDKLRQIYNAAQNPTITREVENIFDEATEPVPAMRAIAGGLDKLGLSPQAANKVANDSLRQSLVASLSDTDIGRTMGLMRDSDVAKGGAAVLSQLQRYVENKKPVFALGKISSGKSAVTDVRMLTPREIGEALGISANDAKEVQKALLDAYTKVPLELRGLGDRVVDYAFKYNPAQKYYARIQSALRYTYNPFFRFQEQVETAVLSRMNANKFLWMQPKEKLNETVDQLTRAGFFEGNLMSAAADDVVFGRISANMTKFQKRNLAGLALTIADRKGLSVEDMINQYPDELDDALRVIVQYPNKGILASSLARTLNVAFFPMRYNAKVTMMAAQKLAEMPPSVQLGVIQGFMKMKDWLQSDEGIRWQSEHSDALQVFKWATPIGSIQSFYKVVTGNVESAGDLGLLGGLPFGVISQVLDSQGAINLNTPYINPTTGDQLPDYIPQTTRARAAVAVNDLLGTMFSFPGRTLGLPGKEATMRKMVDAFIDTNGTDFEKRFDMDNLTPLQEKWIRVLKGGLSPEAIDDLYTSPAPGQFEYYTLPPMDLPERAPRVPGQVDVLSRTEVAARQPQRTSRADRVARPIVRPE